MSISREKKTNGLQKKTKERNNTTTLDDNERSFSCSFFRFVFTSSFLLFFTFSKKRWFTKFRFLFFLGWIIGSFTAACTIGWSLNDKQQDRIGSIYWKPKPCCQRVISALFRSKKRGFRAIIIYWPSFELVLLVLRQLIAVEKNRTQYLSFSTCYEQISNWMKTYFSTWCSWWRRCRFDRVRFTCDFCK